MTVIKRIAKDLAHALPGPGSAVLPEAMLLVEDDRRLEQRNPPLRELAQPRHPGQLLPQRHAPPPPPVAGEPERNGTVHPELVAPPVELDQGPLPRARRLDVAQAHRHRGQ